MFLLELSIISMTYFRLDLEHIMGLWYSFSNATPCNLINLETSQ